MSAAFPRNQEPFAQASIDLAIQNSAQRPISTTIDFSPDPDCLAHEARNWLTVLRVYCDLLRTPGAVASGYESWMEELSGAVERGQELVVSLLDSVERATCPDDLARGESGSVSGTPTAATAPAAPTTFKCRRRDSTAPPSLDIGNAIIRRLPLFERLAGSEIHVEIETPASGGNVLLPETAFERILQNLVRNAIEAMPGGGHLRIALRPVNRRPAGTSGEALHRPVRKRLLLQVQDTGGGIAPEHLSHIFEAGVSSKVKRAEPGQRRGLGLAIVRELTERAGGVVRVRSHLGRGSCFEIELPAA